MTAKRRKRLSIMAQMLERAEEPATKKDVVYDVRLSFTQAKNYIKLLEDLKLLEQINRNGDEAYRTTEKGRKFLGNYRDMLQILEKVSK